MHSTSATISNYTAYATLGAAGSRSYIFAIEFCKLVECFNDSEEFDRVFCYQPSEKLLSIVRANGSVPQGTILGSSVSFSSANFSGFLLKFWLRAGDF